MVKKHLKNKKNPTILDVGANVGNYSNDVLKINKNSRVIAFEPHPVTYKKLIGNICSDNFEPYNLGVGEKADVLKLYDYASQDGSPHASLYKDVISDLHKGGASSVNSVNIVKLDDFLRDKNVPFIDLLKIDVEGNEFNVLLGISRYLSSNKIKAIHFEFNEMNIVSKTSFKDFWDYLSNYRFFRLLPGGRLAEIKNYTPLFCEIYAYQNIIAILKN